MKNSIASLLFLLSLTCSTYGQTLITWEVLKDVDFEDVWSEEFQAYYMVPKFGKRVSALDAKEVQIRGFVIPVIKELSVLVFNYEKARRLHFHGL